MRRAATTGTVALTVAMLVQLVRVAFPLLYDVREDAGAATAVGWALGAFVAVPAIAALALARSSSGWAIRTVVVGLALSRLAVQLVHPIPLWLGALGVATGLTALTLILLSARSRGDGAAAGVAVVVGLAIDTAMFGVFETWDAAWQDGPAAVTTGAVVAIVAAVSALGADLRSGDERSDAWPLALVGPFLFLHVVFVQSVAFATSEIGVPIAGGVAFVLLGDALGVLVAVALVRRDHGPLHVAAAVTSVAAVSVLALVQGESVGLAQPLGAAATAVALTLSASPSATASAPAPASAGPARRTAKPIAWFALGTASFVGAAFAYQIDIDVPLPIPRATWPIVASVLVALGALRGHRATALSVAPVAVPMIGAVVVPLALTIDMGTSPDPTVFGGTYRVLSWNIHTAVNGDGQVVLGDVLDAIMAGGADVVVLQEVGRGWPIAGQSDDLEWLARRLDMTYAWAPAADGQFGNAILSRHPIDVDRVLELPYGEGPQERSAIGVTVGAHPGLFVVGVHLQHGDRPATRTEQIDAVLAAWGDVDSWILAGDLNMQPGEGDLRRLEEAGLTSVQDEIGEPDASTARDPLFPGDRVDWIWATTGTLEVSTFDIPRSDASDHLPLVVDVTP